MKATFIPVACGVAVAAMSAAGLTHWWSVRTLVAISGDGNVRTSAVSMPQIITRKTPEHVAMKEPAAPVKQQAPADNVASADQQRFYQSLISRMESLQTQNRDLLDQLAETNRDLMKLEFRVDTHSASFRPLPVTEEQPFTSLDTDIGVLPPRAEPVMLPDAE
jgi:hypothetical protein